MMALNWNESIDHLSFVIKQSLLENRSWVNFQIACSYNMIDDYEKTMEYLNNSVVSTRVKTKIKKKTKFEEHFSKLIKIIIDEKNKEMQKYLLLLSTYEILFFRIKEIPDEKKEKILEDFEMIKKKINETFNFKKLSISQLQILCSCKFHPK
jgi:hypothetical protein